MQRLACSLHIHVVRINMHVCHMLKHTHTEQNNPKTYKIRNI